MKKLVGFLLVLIFLGFGVTSAHAATLNGWAWSETLGWLSFNSADPGAGGGPYAISINSSGDWSGYAWSEFLGWVSFNVADGLKCNGSAQVHLNTATGAVTGWAYAMTYNPTAEGCIEISGATHSVSYSPSTGKFSGYAWGGDIGAGTGPGWIQFDTSPAGTTGVNCQDSVCGYSGGGITGSCNAITPYQNLAPGTPVTFEATPVGGSGPYHYSWNPTGYPPTPPAPATYDTESPTNRFTSIYSSNAAGPNVVMKDSLGTISGVVACPTVTVTVPIGASGLQIGRTAALATGGSVTLKQMAAFALKWNLSLSNDYSCSASVSPSDTQGWTGTWATAFNASMVNQSGTKTWIGDSGTSLNTGNAVPGLYSLQLTCASAIGATQTVNATLKLNSSTEGEI